MVLSDTMDGSVTEEIFVEDKSGQLWIKEKPDTEGYFTLRSKEAKAAKNDLFLLNVVSYRVIHQHKVYICEIFLQIANNYFKCLFLL